MYVGGGRFLFKMQILFVPGECVDQLQKHADDTKNIRDSL